MAVEVLSLHSTSRGGVVRKGLVVVVDDDNCLQPNETLASVPPRSGLTPIHSVASSSGAVRQPWLSKQGIYCARSFLVCLGDLALASEIKTNKKLLPEESKKKKDKGRKDDRNYDDDDSSR